MEREFKRFRVGQKVIYFDGHYFPLGAKNVKFKGYFAKHQFKTLPHAQALKNPQALRATLGEADYWFKRELPNRE